VLAQDLYRCSIQSLTQAGQIRVAQRSLDYTLQDGCPQCALTRENIRYVAPDRIHATSFHCNPVAERQRSDQVQVGSRAFQRCAPDAPQEWIEIDPILPTPNDVAAAICGRLHLPSADGSSGGSRFTTAFSIPYRTAIRFRRREQASLLLPIETQIHPRIYLPGIPITSGPAIGHFRYQGEHYQARWIVDSACLLVDLAAAQ
jgi:hypothetical protein